MFIIVTIPYDRNRKGFDDELLNRFVLNKHVKTFRAELFVDGGETYWTVLFNYDPVLGRPRRRKPKPWTNPSGFCWSA